MTTVSVNDREKWRRKRVRRNAAWRHIVLAKGPEHPLFGEAFLRYYLPHYMLDGGELVEPAEWHHEFDRTLFGSLGSGEFHVHLAPRGYAKSTKATLATPLAALGLSGLAVQKKLPYGFRPKHYVWFVQDTAPQAKQSMDALLSETENNVRIREDFPHLQPMLGRHKRPVADRDDDVVFQLGLRLQALGSGQKIRGRRHRQYRPDLCLIDDLENDELVLTRYQRDKLDSWLSKSLVPALAKGADLHYVGTLLHHDAVLARVMRRGGWTAHRYEAFGEETDSCPEHGWRVSPDREPENGCDLCRGEEVVRRTTWGYRDVYEHARMRDRMGRRAYGQEVLHLVVDEDSKLFPARHFQYVPDNMYTPERVKSTGEWRVRIGVDVGLTEKEQNDPSAIVVSVKRRGDSAHTVVEAWEGRLRGSRLKQRVAGAWARWGGIVCFESTQAQVWGAEALQDEGIPVEPVHPAKDKVSRAEPVALKYEQGQYHHVESLRDSEFERHLDEFPAGEATHIVDALVHADKGLSQEITAGVAGVIGVEDEPEFRDPRGE